MFQTDFQTLPEFFKHMDYGDLQDVFYSRTFGKGENYYEYGNVSEAALSLDKKAIRATVSGREEYSVSITLQQNVVAAHCNCPAGGNCKHIVAVMLLAKNNPGEMDVYEPDAAINIEEHLNSLSKEDLISLVLKFAPKDFFTEVANSYAGVDEAIKIFKKVENEVKKMLNNTCLLNEPENFEKQFQSQLKKLQGIEKHLTDYLGNFIFGVMDAVEDAFDEGLLYSPYNDEAFVCPEEFYKIAEAHIQHLPFEERTSFLLELEKALHLSGYDTFNCMISFCNDIFSETELPKLKYQLLDNFHNYPESLILKYYRQVFHLLAFDEKVNILSHLNGHEDNLLELAGLYSENGHPEKAISILHKYTMQEKYISNEFYFKYLDLLNTQKLPMEDACLKAIEKNPNNEILCKVISLCPGSTTVFEGIVKEKLPSEYLKHLETRNRLKEALELVKNSKIDFSRRDGFFKKHKSLFKEDAEIHFQKSIDFNLQYTGDAYYHNIQNALIHLKTINPPLTFDLIDDIRRNYKRRINLMKLLEKV